jgi:hypothetical protein
VRTVAKNGKAYDSFNYQHTLLLLNAQEQVISGLTSCRDMEGTRRLACSILRLDARIAYVDIHNYAARAADLENSEPLARVSWDSEEMEE